MRNLKVSLIFKQLIYNGQKINKDNQFICSILKLNVITSKQTNPFNFYFFKNLFVFYLKKNSQ
jgi:hypothetical protein